MSMEKIAPAFIKAKREFAPAMKCASNPHFKSKYADLAECLEAVNDALLNNEIAVMHETSEDATGVTVETVFIHSSGEVLRGGKLHVPAAKQDPQGYGSALTYARRYSLMAACGIAPEDDDGNAASQATRSQPQARPAAKPAGKPTAAPVPSPGLTDEQIDDVILAMVESSTMSELQRVFGDAYKKCAVGQQKKLKDAYDEIKTNLINAGAPA